MCTGVVTCKEDGIVADRYCGNCGHELSPDDQFCRNCGRPAHQAARVPTPEADVPVPPQPQAGGAGGSDTAAAQVPPQEGGGRRRALRGWLTIIGVFAFVAIVGGCLATIGANGGGSNGDNAQQAQQEAPAPSSDDGSKHHTSNNASADKQIIERGKAAREREQNPKPGQAPLPKGDTLEVFYKTTGGAGYAAYAGADGIKQPVDFAGPHYGDEHILYHADHNPGITVDVTRMTVSGTVEVTVVHDGKQIAHAVADESNRNVFITGPPHDLTVE